MKTIVYMTLAMIASSAAASVDADSRLVNPDNAGIMLRLIIADEAAEERPEPQESLREIVHEMAVAVVRREGRNRPVIAWSDGHRPRGKPMDSTFPVDFSGLTIEGASIDGQLLFALPPDGAAIDGSSKAYEVVVDAQRIGNAIRGSFRARESDGEAGVSGKVEGWLQDPDASLDPVGAWAHGLRGEYRRAVFRGPITDTLVRYNLYLPPGYGESKDKLYPVIYDLHGLNNTETTSQNRSVLVAYEAALAAGEIRPAIIVFPNGDIDSMYADTVSGKKPVETQIIRELIPHLDRVYRTSLEDGARVMQGFSMGGFGAALYATKFPDLFRLCIIYDGALHNRETIANRQGRAQLWEKTYGSDPAHFERFSPWAHLEANVDAIRERIVFRQAVGTIVDNNRRFRDALESMSIRNEYIETGQPHSMTPILGHLGNDAFSFIERRWAELGVESPAGHTP